MKKSLAAGVIIAIAVAGFLGLSWLATCGIIKLITLCFGWAFKWSTATGVWLILVLVKSTIDCQTKGN